VESMILGYVLTVIPAALAIGFIGISYFLLTIDRGRATSPSKEDTQAGIKVVLFALCLMGIGMAAGGLEVLLGSVLGGMKGGSGIIKQEIPPIAVGAVTTVFVLKALLPRTNAATQKQAERYFLGVLAAQYGITALIAVNQLLTGLFTSAPWEQNAVFLAMTAISGAILFLAISRFGALSGWTQPVAAPMAPPPQYPPQGGGYPPQGGGYPPQGGGYPPQGGGGYPPQGGGGYPPPGGGGYPPQGGYGR
jgi:hypothetical protein